MSQQPGALRFGSGSLRGPSSLGLPPWLFLPPGCETSETQNVLTQGCQQAEELLSFNVGKRPLALTQPTLFPPSVQHSGARRQMAASLHP